MRIASVTLNPAIDQAVSTERISLGELNRVDVDAIDPGGKGVNASRVVVRLGRESLALGYVAGVTGGLLRARLDAERVPHAFDDVDGLTRVNVMIYERVDGRRTRLYLPGPRVEVAALSSLYGRLETVPPGAVVVIGGSIPPGLPPTVYADLVRWLRARGVRTAVDAAGPALAAVVDAAPDLVKPNLEEATELVGRPLRTDDAVLAAAREIRDRGPATVVISQGAEGAVGVDREAAWKAIAPSVFQRSTVGSGDSMVAGLAIALGEGRGLDEGLRLGTAAGAATATVPGTRLCDAASVAQLMGHVVIRPLAG